MNRNLASLAAVVCATAAFASDSRAQAIAPDALIQWAHSHAIALSVRQSADALDSPVVEAARLRSLVGEARIVALGEPAHGAHGPLAFRNLILERLVEDCGFTAIAMESGLSESRKLNEYVLGAAGDAAAVAKAAFTWGFGDYPENAQLLESIRRYNINPAHVRKLHVYGIDLAGGDEGQFLGARIALDDALEYLARTAPGIHRQALPSIQPFLTKLNRAAYLELTQQQRLRFIKALGQLNGVFESNRTRLIAASSINAYEWARREAVNAAQVEELLRLWPADTPTDSVSPEFREAAMSRDASMAANVRWALEREGASGRILVFAHNAHILNAPLRGGIWNVYRQPPAVMGQRLRTELGSRDYVIIATSAASSARPVHSQDAVNSAPAAESTHVAQATSPTLDGALAEVSRTMSSDADAGTASRSFLLDIRASDLPQAAHDWLARQQTLRANFTTQLEFKPMTALDAIVFLGESNATTAQAQPERPKRIIAALSDVSIEPERRMRGRDARWEHTIQIALPPSYGRTTASYPVLWVTDGPAYFELAVRIVNSDLSGRIPEMIIVAIGPPSESLADFGHRRTYDFSTGELGFNGFGGDLLRAQIAHADNEQRAAGGRGIETGGAAAFLEFLVDEVRPALLKDYRMSGEHILFGDSGGGFFCTYALLARSRSFSKYICGSPNLYASDYALFRMEERYARENKDLPAVVFLGAGESEVLEPDGISSWGIVSSTTRMAEILSQRKYPSLTLHVRIFPGEDHSSVIPLNLSWGLRSTMESVN